MSKFLPTFHILAKLGALFSLLLATPALVSYWYLDHLTTTHLYSAAISFTVCFIVWALTYRFQRELMARDGFMLVTVMWLAFALVASIPFYLSIPNMRFIDAYFEAISGLTTTGFTVIDSLDTLAPSLNFWRHMLNWLGGMGIIVLAVAILPMLGVGGMQLFRAEVSGINKDHKLAPRITQVAKHMWLIYSFFTIIIALALKAAGMSWFDAICHAMSSVSLSGFSTHSNSIAYFQSPLIEWIIMIAMLLGIINYTNHFTAFHQRSLKPYRQDTEIKISFFLLPISVIAIAWYLWRTDTYDLLSSFRYALFNVVSVGVSGGFSSTNFGEWPLVTTLWMLFLANIVSNSGSTGGGIKTIRLLVLIQFMMREVVFLLHPNAVRTVKINHLTVSERTALTVLAFIFVYFACIVVFTFVMMLTGLDFLTALSFMIACITNAGQALGNLGPANTCSGLADFQKIIALFVMLLGRLEVFTLFILFTPAYWRK